MRWFINVLKDTTNKNARQRKTRKTKSKFMDVVKEVRKVLGIAGGCRREEDNYGNR